MQLRLDIICPHHLKQEVLTLPDSYSADFSGEVPCGAEAGGRATLYIALKVGEGKELRLVEIPFSFTFSDLLASSHPSRPAPAGARTARATAHPAEAKVTTKPIDLTSRPP